MNPLDRLLGRSSDDGPPDLQALVDLPDASRVAIVHADAPYGDGGVGEAFPSATRIAQRDGDLHTLPFREGDPCHLPSRDDGWELIVVQDVLDRVLDPANALRAAGEALAPGGKVLLLQRVGPDDFSDRAGWNVLARLADTRQTWTSNRRQTRALAGGAGLRRGAEALWEEWVPLAEPQRPGTAELHRLFATALDGSGVVRDGCLVMRRVAVVLERR